MTPEGDPGGPGLTPEGPKRGCNPSRAGHLSATLTDRSRDSRPPSIRPATWTGLSFPGHAVAFLVTSGPLSAPFWGGRQSARRSDGPAAWPRPGRSDPPTKHQAFREPDAPTGILAAWWIGPDGPGEFPDLRGGEAIEGGHAGGTPSGPGRLFLRLRRQDQEQILSQRFLFGGVHAVRHAPERSLQGLVVCRIEPSAPQPANTRPTIAITAARLIGSALS